MFITFEAPEGAGKSTQARLLKTALNMAGVDAILTREPGGSPGAEEIRRLVLEGDPGRWSAETELLLFTAARRDHVEKVIKPALAAGKIVICDRYDGSTYALQGAAGIPDAQITLLQSQFIGLEPDLTLFIDIDLETSLNRSLGRLAVESSAEDRFESKGLAFHRAVYDRYQDLAKQRETWVRIDGSGDIETVARRIRATLARYPGLTGLSQLTA